MVMAAMVVWVVAPLTMVRSRHRIRGESLTR